MRFFEINNPKIQPAPQAGVPPVDATKEVPPQDAVVPAEVEAEPN